MSVESSNDIERTNPRETAETREADLEIGKELKIKAIQEPHPEYQYLDLMSETMLKGNDRAMHVPGDQGIRCTLGARHTYNLQEGLPVLTTKDVFWRGVTTELKWFLNGDTNIKYLVDQGIHIWDDDAFRRYQRYMRQGQAPQMDQAEYIGKIKEEEGFAQKWGNLGPVYGEQWRAWKNPYGGETDQIKWLVEQLRDPIAKYRKSNLVSAWNPSFLPGIAPTPEDEVSLPPCHVQFQTDVDEQDRLTVLMYQRSGDIFLGVPFNIASYAVFTHLLAQVSDLEPYQFIHMFGNTHVYHKHFDAAREQLQREPYPFARVQLDPKIKEIDNFQPSDAKIVNYKHHPRLKAEMLAVGGRIDNPVELKKEQT